MSEGNGFRLTKMKRGDVIRLGNGVVIELRSEGESVARVAVSVPRDVPIIIERGGIPSPFQQKKPSDI